jgi:RNA recognition motif-containing protein
MAFVTFWNARDAIAALDEVVLYKGGRRLKISIPFLKSHPKNDTQQRYNRASMFSAQPKHSKVQRFFVYSFTHSSIDVFN